MLKGASKHLKPTVSLPLNNSSFYPEKQKIIPLQHNMMQRNACGIASYCRGL